MTARFTAAHRRLLELMADTHFHSGPELADYVNISRSGVWKQIHSLQNLGIEIDAVTGKGYRLVKPLELLDEALIHAHLSPLSRQNLSKFRIQPEIDSTNDDLMRQMAQQAPSGTVSLTEYQSAGKGRVGRQWVSPFGRNIYLSLLWRFQGGPGVISGLSLAAGVAIVKALQVMGLEGAGVKWPNDILWQDRKLAGILVEVSGESLGPCAVVMGVGLNLYMPSAQATDIDQPWVDVDSIMNGQSCSRNRMVAEILNQLLPVMMDFEQTGLEPVLDEWRALDSMRGRKVVMSVGGDSKLSGIAAGISDDGRFLVEDTDGVEHAFVSGEVSLSLAPD